MIDLEMGTEEFNVFDKVIAYLRSNKIKKLIKKGDRVMDFGCGYQGYFLKYVSGIIKSGVGMDYDVKNSKFNNLEFKKFAFVNKLPEGIGKFEKIVMLAVLEHVNLDKVDILFTEFGRVLEDNGQIILTTPTKFSQPILEALASLGIISKKEIADHKKYYSSKDIAEMAAKNKLKLVSYRLFQWGLNSVAILEKI